MKKRIFVVLVTAFIVFPFSAKAVCTNSKKTEYMEMAQNITTAYIFNEETKQFDILLNNIPEDFIVKDVSKKKEYEYVTSELMFKNYTPGNSYRFDILNKYDCLDETLASIYVILPMYNSNYQDPLCRGYEDYDICQKWGKYIRDHNAFKSEIKSITIKNKKNTGTNTMYEYKGIFSGLASIFTKVYYVVLPLIIITGLVGIYYLNKKEKLF